MNIEEKIDKVNVYLPSMILSKLKVNPLKLSTNEDVKNFYIEECNGLKITKRELLNLYPSIFKKLSSKEIDVYILNSFDKINFLEII